MLKEILLDNDNVYETTIEDRYSALCQLIQDLDKTELEDLVLDIIDRNDLEEELYEYYYDEMYEILYDKAKEIEDELKLIKEEEKRRHS